VKFLIDNQLPRMLVHLLVSQGHEACHVAGVGLGDASDETVWLRAARESAVIISKDEDFARRVYLGQPPPVPVIWLRLGNCRNAHLRQAMQDSLPAIIAQLKAGDQLIEVY
jgi:predicted nuclease of predicted toxin-antitoxin system